MEQHNDFWLLIHSDPHLGDSVKKIFLDLGERRLDLDMIESNTHKVTDWLLTLQAKKELLTLALLDQDENPRCVMALEDIYLLDHHCGLYNGEPQYARTSHDLRHKVVLMFGKAEKLDIETYTVAVQKKEE